MLKKIACLLGVFTAICGTSQAQETRYLKQHERLLLQEKRAQLFKEAEKKGISAEGEMRAFSRPFEGKEGFYTSNQFMFKLMPEAAHILEAVDPFGDRIEFDDGTTWNISLEDRWEVSLWLPLDIVYVTQSDYMSNSHAYMIINESRGTAVYAARLGKPYIWPYAKEIFDMDSILDRILLNDGTIWNIAWIDDSIFKRWLPGDRVIIGINSGHDSYRYPYLLINVGIDTLNLGIDEYVGAQRGY